MPTLRNPRHERFAQELAKGTSATQAYEIAGFKPNAGNAGALRAKQHISTRVNELLTREQLIEAKATEKAITKLSLTKERVLEELMRIGYANIADYVNVSGDNPSWDLKNVPREVLAAVAELTTETVFERTRANGAPSEVRKVKLKFWDKKGALVDLGKHLGLFKEQLEITGRIETDGQQARDIVSERLAQLSERVAKEDGPDKPTLQ
jgi:phage terminase small subunit